MTKTEDSKVLYAERHKRLHDTVALKETDRVPSVLFGMFWYAKYGGVTCQEIMYNYDKLSELLKRAVEEFQPDCYQLPHPVVALGPTMEAMDYKPLEWPGHGTDPNVSYQYLDKEYMSAAEYEDYIFDPTGFYLSKYLPRIAGVAEGFSELPIFPAQYYIATILGSRSYANPKIMQSFQAMAKAGEEANKMLGKGVETVKELAAAGFPLARGTGAMAPFDYFSDYFRGSKGAMMDMYRNGDVFLEAMNKAAVFLVRNAILESKMQPSNIIFIPIHWAFDGLMSEEHFKTYFWPPFKKVILGLIEADLIPLCLWEGDCTSRMELIGEIPSGKAIYWFERGDMFKAKEILGDVVCLRGNVPASLLNMGSPDEVDEYCKKLIQVVGKGGGLILDGGIGIPDEAKHENVRAMFEAPHKYAN